MEMSPIADCEVTDCCYNSDHKCHALAIQIGDGATHPVCDTFAGLQASQCGDPSVEKARLWQSQDSPATHEARCHAWAHRRLPLPHGA
jgi:hypothetical protein